MATQFPGDQSTGMVDRIKRLLTAPEAEWARIDAEPMTVRGIFTGWIVPLAAIGPIAGLIRSLLFGYGAFGISYRPSVTSALLTAVTLYAVALIGIYVLALIVDALAPSFGGAKNPVAAMKVVAFSWTAAWLAGIFQVIPGLWWLGLVGLYSFYLLWIGLPMLMKSPADRAAAYVAVAIVLAIVATAVIGAVASSISWSIARPVLSADAGTVDGKLTVPGVGQVDLGKIDAASKRMEAMTARMQADAANGTTSAVPAAALQAMLPTSIGGFTRGDLESTSGGAGGINGSRAEGRYTAGDQSFTLSVADAGAMGALATLGGALNVQSNKQTATGYEKTEMVGGAMVTERWNTDSHSGSYQSMVASRFIVAADGNAPNIDTLKQAVASIDTGKLVGLAK
jgi:hypothetical protein